MSPTDPRPPAGDEHHHDAGTLVAHLHDRYGVLFEGAPLGIGIAQAGVVLHANPRLREILGYERVEELHGRRVPELVAPADRPAIAAALQRFAGGAEYPRGYAVQMLRKDGSTVPVEIQVTTIALPDGLAAVAFMTDVSARVAAEQALRASEAQYRELSEAMSDVAAAMRIEPDGTIRPEWASQSLDRFTGLSAAERAARGGWSAFIHPEDLSTVLRAFASARAEGMHTGDCRMRRHDGTWRWFRHFVRVAPDEEGRTSRVVTSAYDVTELRQAEEERAHNQTLLRIGRDLAVDLAATRSLDEGLQRCLRAVLAVPGIDGGGIYLAEPDTGDLLLACHDGLAPAFTDEVQRVSASSPQASLLQRHLPVFVELAVAIPPGLDRVARHGFESFAALPLVHEGMLLGCVNAVSRELDRIPERTRSTLETIAAQAGGAIARLRAEAGRRQGEERLRRYLSLSPVPLATVQPDDSIEHANRRFVELFGFAKEELPTFAAWWGRVCADPQRRQQLRAAWDAAADDAEEGDEIAGGELEVACGDGARRWIDLRGARIGDRLVVSFADLTPFRRLQAQVQQAQKMEALGRLAGGIAHDFNNLLTVITSCTGFALEALEADSPLRGDLADALKAAAGAAALTEQLVAFSRSSVVQPRRLSLNRLVADVERIIGRLVGEDIVIHLALAEGLGSVSADAGQLEQVLINLVLNARDAMPEGGALRVSTGRTELDARAAAAQGEARPGCYVTLEVRDEGTGIPAEALPHLFEPFFTTKRDAGHAGLGLATVYGIVRQAGGYLLVDSAPGAGTTVRVLLPALDEAVEEPRPSLPPVRAGDDAPEAGAGRVVLLVEDAVVVRRVARRLLERHGFVVLEAVDGGEALRLAAERRGEIAVVLTDVVMPRMGGPELAEKLRPLLPGVPVVFMSGYTPEAIARRGVLAEGVPVVHKPFNREALVRTIDQALAHARRAAAGG